MSNPHSPEFFELSDPHPQSSPTAHPHPASTGTVQSVDHALALASGPETEESFEVRQEKENHVQKNEEYTEFDPMAEVSPLLTPRGHFIRMQGEFNMSCKDWPFQFKDGAGRQMG